MLHLVDLILTLPVGSADCERCFNRVKTIKTEWRTRLSRQSLNDQLAILLSDTTIETFNPEPAVDLWNRSYSRKRKLDHALEPEASDEEEDELAKLEEGANMLRHIVYNLSSVVVPALPTKDGHKICADSGMEK